MNELTLQEKVEIFVRKNKILKKDFAKSIGITPVKLSHWLKGHVLFNRSTLTKIIAEMDNE